jgi:hypothetical protein
MSQEILKEAFLNKIEKEGNEGQKKMRPDFDNVAQAIDNSHKDPSEVKDITVNGAPVIEETLADNLHDFGFNQEQQEMETHSAKLEMAQDVVNSIGLNPTFKEWKAVRNAVFSGHVAFNETLSNPRKVETLENKATLFMRLLENEFQFVKPKSESKDSTRKNKAKNDAQSILNEKYDGSISVAEDQLRSLDQLTPNLAFGTEEYSENEKEKATLRRVINQAQKAKEAENKKAVSGTLSKCDDMYRKLKSLVRKTGNGYHAQWLEEDLQNLLKKVEAESYTKE